jgi:hypothetical protein
MGSIEKLKQRGEAAGPDDQRSIVNLLIDQVEFANVILLNKVCDDLFFNIFLLCFIRVDSFN